MNKMLHFRGRGTNKTTQIINQSKPGDVIICHNAASAMEISRHFSPAKKVFVATVGNIYSYLKDIDFRKATVWLDEFDWMSIQDQNNIYEFLMVNLPGAVIGYSSPKFPLDPRLILKSIFLNNKDIQMMSQSAFDFFKHTYIAPNLSYLFLYADQIYNELY